MRQKELSIALKGIIVLCLLAGLLLCGILVPSFGMEIANANPDVAWLFWPCLSFVWLTCVPVLAVLILVWKIATQIGLDNSFCFANAKRLKWVCVLAIADIALYVLGALTVFTFCRGLPPIFLFFFFFVISLGIAIAVVAAVFSHLVQKGADMKAEQDLTI